MAEIHVNDCGDGPKANKPVNIPFEIVYEQYNAEIARAPLFAPRDMASSKYTREIPYLPNSDLTSIRL